MNFSLTSINSYAEITLPAFGSSWIPNHLLRILDYQPEKMKWKLQDNTPEKKSDIR